jgi:hypothetical protein
MTATDTARARWFFTKSNHVLHHALNAETGTATCNRVIVPRIKGEAWAPSELIDEAQFCPRCLHRIKDLPVIDTAQSLAKTQGKPKRLTASQTRERLTLLQREQLLAWFVATYAPSRNAARFVLTKNPSLTHAESVIAETWKGMGQ